MLHCNQNIENFKKMFEEAYKKSDKISAIWINYILNHKFCRNRINFKEEQTENYFRVIHRNFLDTFGVLNSSFRSDDFTDVFEHTISFLQAIYLQQDFIEEYHYIFGTGIDKGKLKSDKNYSINREIRNEIIGHPIRKTIVTKDEREVEYCKSCGQNLPSLKRRQVILSSALFSNKTNSNQIYYLKYHRDNNYKFKEEKHRIDEVKERHNKFLINNLNIIIAKLKSILSLYSEELIKIQEIQCKIPLVSLLNIIEQKFENITIHDYLYKREHLIKLLKKKKEHKRYKVALKAFYSDLDLYLKETIASIEELVNDKDIYSRSKPKNYLKSKVIIIPNLSKPDIPKDNKITKPSYTYELEKLAEPEIGNDNFFSGLLRFRYKGMPIVLEEINYLESNKHNEFEYYSSYVYLKRLLKADG